MLKFTVVYDSYIWESVVHMREIKHTLKNIRRILMKNEVFATEISIPQLGSAKNNMYKYENEKYESHLVCWFHQVS